MIEEVKRSGRDEEDEELYELQANVKMNRKIGSSLEWNTVGLRSSQ